jgi:hypothetical protein
MWSLWIGSSQVLLAAIACILFCGCVHAPPASPEALVYVSVVDVAGRPSVSGDQALDTTLLHAEVPAATPPEYDALCELAAAHFPEGQWGNLGPDSRYREITLPCGETIYVLRSWHPIFEDDPSLVAASYGITPLDGQTRQEFLAADDPAYVAKRQAFDAIEQGLYRLFAK